MIQYLSDIFLEEETITEELCKDDSNRKRVMEYYQRFVALSEKKQIEVMRYIDDVER